MTKKTHFYPDVRDHTSPSALAKRIDNPAGFDEQYFGNVKVFQTPQMKEGIRIHKLIEQGRINVKCRYEHAEEDGGALDIPFKVGRLNLIMRVRFDSWEQKKNVAYFVDYKTGKAWTQQQAADDWKQKFNAWCIWKHTGITDIRGAIEHVDGDSVDAKTKVLRVKYTEEDLLEIDAKVQELVREINEAYIHWEARSDAFLQEDQLRRYSELKGIVAQATDEMREISNVITSQMEAGGLRKAKTAFGTFSFTDRKTYAYPKALEDEQAKIDAKKKAYRDSHDPQSITRTLSFRA